MAIYDRLLSLVSPKAALRRGIKLNKAGRFGESFPLLAVSARAGIPEGEYQVARSYLEGAGVPPSRAEGARWLQRAASHGIVEAQSLLAALCLNGLIKAPGGATSTGERPTELFVEAEATAESDFETAFVWAQRAARAGCGKGQALLGYVLTNGPEPMRDLDDARRWYRASAESGCPEGNLGYALALMPGATADYDWRLIRMHLKAAADAGLPTALYVLGALTERGSGCPRDAAGALEFYQRAAEKGNCAAQFRLGILLT